jgi:nitrate reductase gamma subunit
MVEKGNWRVKARTLMATAAVAVIVPVACLVLTGASSQARASWFIDPKKLHASVHGQRSCQDCHEDVGKRKIHPNPEDVDKSRLDFFNVDECVICHTDIQDKLDQGMHGSKKIEDAKAYQNCLSCHNPHEEIPVREEASRFDPSRPRYEQCGACHKLRSALPPLSPEDEACMSCHRAIDPNDRRAAEKIGKICFTCHAQEPTEPQKLTAKKVSLIMPDDYGRTSHAGVACTVCHPAAAEFGHNQQKPGDCRQCHLPHDEKVAHDLHGMVSCGACHLRDVQVMRDPVSRLVIWKRQYKPNEPSRIHDMLASYDEKACRACHRAGNDIGAAAMILPAKSILCMPCHAGTFSAGDTTTVLALIVFVVGMVMAFSYVLTGGSPERRNAGALANLFHLFIGAMRSLFSVKMGVILKALFLDVLLQRRLYGQSPKRWLIHSLIFYPFAFRFTWGIIALTGSIWRPEWSFVWPMLDKNYPVSAFVFDMTGLMLTLGVALAMIHGAGRKRKQLPNLPNQDRAALLLIGATAVVGFVLEGMRIAMTGYPEGAHWAFIGYGLSEIFRNGGTLVTPFGYVWYVHAILTGAFVAYIPFSRLLHMIIGPVVLAGNAAREREHGKG